VRDGQRGYFPVSAVLQAARGRWRDVLGRFGVKVELLSAGHGPCPGCGGRDRFRFDDQDGDGTFICSQGGGGNLAGNGLALMVHCTGWDWKVCVERVGALLLPDSARVGDVGDSGSNPMPRSIYGDDVAPMPQPPVRQKRPLFDPSALEGFVKACPAFVNEEWLLARSPVALPAVNEQGRETAELFLRSIYEPGERVLVFTSYWSQGDFLWDGQGWRLAAVPDVPAVRSELPTGGPEGVWFLNQPVDGAWHINPSGKEAKLGRRHSACVTRWPFLVLESDVAAPDLWLRAVALLPLAVAAIYTSGGRSIHALVRLDAEDKPTFDWARDELAQVLCPLGADAAAMTAVRLTRLPGMLRHGGKDAEGKLRRYERPRLQRLLWLNPGAEIKPILEVVA
jgi:hypothetical protein